MSTDSDALVERIRQRDVEALAGFIDARRGALLVYIERQLGAALRRKLEPEDVFQEVSAEAVRGLPAIDLANRDPFGWLCQIAERRIIDAHRRFFGAAKRDAGREVSLNRSSPDDSRAGMIDLLVASMTTASKMYSRNVREARLAEALASLPFDQREALRLRYVEGLPSKQIALQLGKTDGAVRVMLTRSLNRLQSILGPDAAPS
ncbi:MAG: sigma-70 family RNA polymerase sigma factor [Planctomycetia bacterium]|nr:sigma-70 family RNA polymerase sigma factor [Planctomycetia bacterium]